MKKDYGERKVLDLEHISVEPGEVLACLGPSGAGKSVLLRLLNLLERPTTGDIFIDGEGVSSLKGKRRVEVSRRMAMLFQDPLLFSTSVFKNVAYGLRVRRVPTSEIGQRVAAALRMVNLSEFSEKHVATLSGGEAQRIALARALVVQPELVFLDEPFANLDRLSREALQVEVKRILKELGLSGIFVTHDQEEAARMGDRILILHEGRAIQDGTAYEIFYRPSSEFVARFVGMENLFRGIVIGKEEGLAQVDVEGQALEAVTDAATGVPVTLGIRPEDITLVPPEQVGAPASSRNALRGRVVEVEHLGPIVRVTAECPFNVTAVITRRSLEELEIDVGSEVGVRFKVTSMHAM